MHDQELIKMLSEASNRMSEHFDSLTIIGTGTREGATQVYWADNGNQYSLVESVREWLLRRETRSRIALEHDAIMEMRGKME